MTTEYRARGMGFEPLESRQLLAAIVWDGGPAGAGTDFNTAANWVGDVLPGPADTAVINTAGATPVVSSDIQIQALQSSRSVRIDTGATLTTTGTNSLSQDLILHAGRLLGGTWNFSGVARIKADTASGGTLENVQYGGELLLNAASTFFTFAGSTTFFTLRMQVGGTSVQLTSGFTLLGSIIAEGAATGIRAIDLGNSPGTVTIGPSGQITTAPAVGGDLQIMNGSSVSLVNNGSIISDGGIRALSLRNGSLTNNGLLQSTSGTLDIRPTTWSNAGTISALAGATVNCAGAWTDPGLIQSSGGFLTFGGTFSLPQMNLAGINCSGGVVLVSGSMDLAGGNLPLTTALGRWVLAGGVISGGQIVPSGSGSLGFSSNGGSLVNIALAADIILDTQGANVTIVGATTFVTAHLANGLTTITLPSNYVLNSAIVAEASFTGIRTINIAPVGASPFIIGPAGAIRLLAGCGGDLNLMDVSLGELENRGVISSDAGGRFLNIRGAQFLNVGTASCSGRIAFRSDVYRNTGTISGSGSASVYFMGTFDTTAGEGTIVMVSSAAVNVQGVIRNTGNLLELNAATGSWYHMPGSVISGGSLSYADGRHLIFYDSGGALENIAVLNDLVIDQLFTGLTLRGTTTFPLLRVTTGTLTLASGFVLSSLISIEGGTVQAGTGGSDPLIISASGELRVLSGLNLTCPNPIINYGLISNASAHGTITFSTPSFRNEGAMRSTLDNPFSQGGFAFSSTTTWRNYGIIDSSLGYIDSAGTFDATVGLGIIRSAMGISGTFLNSGNTFTVFRSFGVNGGTIIGGSIVAGVNTTTEFTSSTTGRAILRDVQFVGDVTVFGNDSTVRFEGSTSVTSIKMNGSSPRIEIAGGNVFNSIVYSDHISSNATLTIIAVAGFSPVATISSVARIQFGEPLYSIVLNGDPGVTLVNHGLISLASGRPIRVNASSFTNFGTLEMNGGSLDFASGTWSNSGIVRASASTVLLRSTFITTFGMGSLQLGSSPVTLSGIISNTNGDSIIDAAGGVWTISGGTIVGGRLTLTEGQILRTAAAGVTLDSVYLTGEIVLNTANSFANIRGAVTISALRMQAAGTNAKFAAGSTFSGLLSIEGAATGTRTVTIAYDAPGQVTLASGAILRLASGVAVDATILLGQSGTLQNLGLISAEASGRQILLQVPLTNLGTLSATGGSRLSIQRDNWSNDGILTAAGAEILMSGAGTFTNRAFITLGPGGLLTIQSQNFVQAISGMLDVTIAGANSVQCGRVVATNGSAFVAGSLIVRLGSGFTPALFSSIEFLTVANTNQSLAGSFSDVALPLTSSDQKFALISGDRYLRLGATSTADINNDLTVDFFDYLDFVQAFSTSDPAADFNGDATVDFFDYLDFLVVFSRF